MTEVVRIGKGRFDRQTSLSKGPSGLARLAREHGTPVVRFAGSVQREDELELSLFHKVVDLPPGNRRAYRPPRCCARPPCAGQRARLKGGGRP